MLFHQRFFCLLLSIKTKLILRLIDTEASSRFPLLSLQKIIIQRNFISPEPIMQEPIQAKMNKRELKENA